MINDFHAMNALKWGCTRAQAKSYACAYVYGDVLSPTFLRMIDNDARADILARFGIIVGEN